MITFLRAVFDSAIDLGAIGTNPWLKIKRPPEPPSCGRPMSGNEFWKLYHSTRAESSERALGYAVMYFTGMDRGEALRLTWADVDLRRKEITASGRKKGNVAGKHLPRIVPIAPQLLSILSAFEAEPHAPVLSSRFNFSKWMKRDCDGAGIAYYRIKDLRHSFGTMLGREGVSPFTVKDLMGHASMQTTQRYVRMGAEQLTAAREALGRIGNGSAKVVKIKSRRTA